jgi:DNA-binding NtrC family response regulator
MLQSPTRVLAVDDDVGSTEAVERLLAGEGYEVRTANDSVTAELLQRAWAPDVVILDLVLPGVSGCDLIKRLRDASPDTPIIVISGHATVPATVEALTAGAFSLLEKPVDGGRLLALLEKAAALRPRPVDNDQTVDTLGRLRTLAPAMRAVFDMVRMTAPTDINVLIVGENGTGKELVACSIHDLSPRRAGPFIKVNCAAIPGELLEAELFGSKKGSYTGSIADRKGLFELAHRGSILLDEIGDMPPVLQAKLLRVLQEREFRPVGGTTVIRADFRLVCATNIDPLRAVQAGRLREDLYFRLNTLVVAVPPLRDRSEDIVLLARDFLATFAARYHKVVQDIDGAALAALERHEWRGNVRELEHAIERGVIMSKGSVLHLQDLPEPLGRRAPVGQATPALAARFPGGCTLMELERLAIMETLERTGWNKRATAEILGIHRPTLYNKMRRYGLWRPKDRFRHLDREEREEEEEAS